MARGVRPGARPAALVADPALALIPNLAGYFPGHRLTRRNPAASLAGGLVLTSGREPWRSKAQALAGRTGAVALCVDDGFVRSVATSSAGAVAVSLILEAADGFSAGRSGRLEAWLDTPGWEDPALMQRAARLLAFKQARGLSRFNAGEPPRGLPAGPCVLIAGPWRDGLLLDQAAADAGAWAAIAAAARNDNPDATLLWLSDGAPAPASDLVRLNEDLDLAALLARVDSVYTHGGLAGLEAVFAGKRVVLSGAPFYGGRGLTQDRSGRTPRKARSVIELFAAAYLLHAVYADPLTGQACTPETAFERLDAFADHARRTAGDFVGLNIQPAKWGVIRAFLSGPRTRFRHGTGSRAGEQALAWASQPNGAVERARRAGRPITWVEDGFLRSVGLGAGYHPAASLVLDKGGIYYDPGSGSDLDALLNGPAPDAAMLEAARRLRAAVVEAGLTKYNLGGKAPPIPESAGRKRILVPGQVEDDASVLTGGGGMSNLALLRRVRESEPGAFIAYKEHPDVTAGVRRGAVEASELAGLADHLVRDADILECLDQVDEVHTLTSLAGFEALLRGRPVTVYGWPFYAGRGLTRDRGPIPAPARRTVSLDELTAAALIAYPLYLDPISWLPCSAATFIERLTALRRDAGEARATGGLGLAARAVSVVLRPPRPPVY